MVAVILKGYGNVLLNRQVSHQQADMSSAMRSQVSLQTHSPLGSQDLTVVENSAFAYRVKMKLEWIIVGSMSKRWIGKGDMHRGCVMMETEIRAMQLQAKGDQGLLETSSTGRSNEGFIPKDFSIGSTHWYHGPWVLTSRIIRQNFCCLSHSVIICSVNPKKLKHLHWVRTDDSMSLKILHSGGPARFLSLNPFQL